MKQIFTIRTKTCVQMMTSWMPSGTVMFLQLSSNITETCVQMMTSWMPSCMSSRNSRWRWWRMRTTSRTKTCPLRQRRTPGRSNG